MDKNTLGILAIVFVVVLAVSGTFGEFDFANITSGLPLWGGTDDSNLVDVSKQIKGYLADKYGGGAIDTGDNVLNLYLSDGKTLAEGNLETDANGHFTTGTDYPSGSVMYLRYEESNTKQWFKFTVPQMNSEDAQSATTNLVKHDSFTLGTYTDSAQYANGTAITDGYTHNVTNGDGTTLTMTYTLTDTGDDNTGIMASYDPLYGQNWNIELYITFSGTGYEKVIVYGLDYDFTLGTTHYVGKTMNPYSLTKHKQGLTYTSLGTVDTQFWMDLSGLSGADSVTMQIYVYAYADQAYARVHGGSFGPEAYQLAEQTVTLTYT